TGPARVAKNAAETAGDGLRDGELALGAGEDTGMASKSGRVYIPPSKLEQPFPEDYPACEWPGGLPHDPATGRLTQDIDGRQINPDALVAGRRVVGGPNQPLSAPEVVSAATEATGGSPSAVASHQLRGDAGQYVVTRDR